MTLDDTNVSLPFDKTSVPELTRHELNRIIELEPQRLAMAIYMQLVLRGETPEARGILIRNIISMVDGKQEKLVQILLRCFREAVQSTPPDLETLSQNVVMLSIVELLEDCPLRAALWRSGLVAILLDAFDVLCKETRLRPRDQRIIDAWHQNTIFVLNSANSKHDRTLLNEVFQHRFLKALITCFPDVGQPSVPEIREHLLKCLTNVSRFLPYTSILRAIEPDIGSLSRTVHQRMVDSPQGSEWRAFLRCFMERLVFKWHRDFFNSRLKKKVLPCDNCGKEVNEIKKCAACKSAFYCSKECQLAGWKGHKSDCKRFQHKENGSYDNGLPPVPPRDDLELMYHIASNDAHRHQVVLRDLASRKHPNVASKDLAVFIDYSEVPPVLDVYRFNASRSGVEAVPNPKSVRAVSKVTNRNDEYRALEFCIPNSGQNSCFSTEFKRPPMASLFTNGSEQPGARRVQFVDSLARPAKATSDIVDDLMRRSGITADALLDTDLSVTDIRRKVFQTCDVLFGPKLMNELFEDVGLD